MRVKIFCLLAFLAMATTAHAQKKIVCYYESWAKYRNGDGKYTINNINADLCTHVIYSFVGINTDGSIKLLDDAADLISFTDYIRKFQGVKAMLAIGGASESSKKFSTVVNNFSTRQRFVNNMVSFLQKYHFQGLDVDWEYPSRNGGSSSDKRNFVRLLRELKQAFSGKGLSLSAAVGADVDSALKSYNIPQISRYLDFINIMTYDFSGSWDNQTGLNSPLYPSSKDDSYQRTLNVNASIHYWLSQGAPKNKVIVGLPFYGQTYTLKDANKHGLHDPTSGAGPAGPYTGEAGTIGYNEMCVDLQNDGWHVVQDTQTRVPYAYKGNEWVSYDDPQSIKEKCQFVKSLNLGGAMIWSVDTDDFQGKCGAKHILLSTVHDALK